MVTGFGFQMSFPQAFVNLVDPEFPNPSFPILFGSPTFASSAEW